MTHPMAGPCDSPKVVTENKVPNELPDINWIKFAERLNLPRIYGQGVPCLNWTASQKYQLVLKISQMKDCRARKLVHLRYTEKH